MTLGSISSLATTAFDTARTTFKAMADAAVPPADAGGSGGSGQRSTRTAAPQTAAAAKAAGRADTEEQEPASPSRRRGTVLDAYA